jgi:hypothetical protein
MPLVVEDGTGKVDAQSYVTESELLAYAAARGFVWNFDPQTDEKLDPLLVNAADYLNGLESSFCGTRTTSSQALAWPRRGVELFDDMFPHNAIPRAVKDAQCQLALDLATLQVEDASASLQSNTGLSQGVKRERVEGAVDVEYFTSSEGGEVDERYTKAMSILDPVLCPGKGGHFVSERA